MCPRYSVHQKFSVPVNIQGRARRCCVWSLNQAKESTITSGSGFNRSEVKFITATAQVHGSLSSAPLMPNTTQRSSAEFRVLFSTTQQRIMVMCARMQTHTPSWYVGPIIIWKQRRRRHQHMQRQQHRRDRRGREMEKRRTRTAETVWPSNVNACLQRCIYACCSRRL